MSTVYHGYFVRNVTLGWVLEQRQSGILSKDHHLGLSWKPMNDSTFHSSGWTLRLWTWAHCTFYVVEKPKVKTFGFKLFSRIKFAKFFKKSPHVLSKSFQTYKSRPSTRIYQNLCSLQEMWRLINNTFASWTDDLWIFTMGCRSNATVNQLWHRQQILSQLFFITTTFPKEIGIFFFIPKLPWKYQQLANGTVSNKYKYARP